MSVALGRIDVSITLGVAFGFFGGWLCGRLIDRLMLHAKGPLKAAQQREYIAQRAKSM